jgi:hypothetical protein
MRLDLNLLLRNDLLSFAKKAFWEMNAQRMPDDRYLELLASRLARGRHGRQQALNRQPAATAFQVLDRLGLPLGVDPGP